MNLCLPHCQVCARSHWPSREICPYCLGHEIQWTEIESSGSVVTATLLHHSLEPRFREHLPVCVATIQLDCGVCVLVYLDSGDLAIGDRVIVSTGTGPTGQEALVAKSVTR